MPWIETDRILIPMFGSDIIASASVTCSLTGRVRHLALVSDEVYLRKIQPDFLRKLRIRKSPRSFYKRRKLRNVKNVDFGRIQSTTGLGMAGLACRKIFFPLLNACGYKGRN